MKSKATNYTFVLFVTLIGIALILNNYGGGGGDGTVSTITIKAGMRGVK